MNTTGTRLDSERTKLESFHKEIANANAAIKQFSQAWRAKGGDLGDQYWELRKVLADAEARYTSQLAIVSRLHKRRSEALCSSKKGEVRKLALDVAEKADALDAALVRCDGFVGDLMNEGVEILEPARAIQMLVGYGNAARGLSSIARRMA